MKKKIKILGEEWKIIKDKQMEDEFDGLCIYENREIRYKKSTELNRCLRHEIIHAFMFESGLGFNFEHNPIGIDETMVDWIAIQYPKIRKVFKKLEIEK